MTYGEEEWRDRRDVDLTRGMTDVVGIRGEIDISVSERPTAVPLEIMIRWWNQRKQEELQSTYVERAIYNTVAVEGRGIQEERRKEHDLDIVLSIRAGGLR